MLKYDDMVHMQVVVLRWRSWEEGKGVEVCRLDIEKGRRANVNLVTQCILR